MISFPFFFSSSTTTALTSPSSCSLSSFLSFFFLSFWFITPFFNTSSSSSSFLYVSAHPSHGAEEDFLVFLFFAILVGAFMTYLITRYFTELHYTVILFFLGVIIAVGFHHIHDGDLLELSILQWEGFNGDLIIYVFLPALLFGDASNLNFHHVKTNFNSAVLLAGPGAVLGALLTGVFVKGVLPYGWDWSLSFLFGSIVCATDPVAVVALLNAVGASTGLTYIIVGEALLNDGSALVLYTLFYKLVDQGESHTLLPSEVVIYFIKVIFISPLIGLGIALGSIVLIGLANMKSKPEDTTIQLAITLCAAYYSFYIAQRICNVSGVIACCTAGVFLSRYAIPRYLNAETIHAVWEAIEWIGNTLLFFLAGLIIGNLAILKVEAIDLLYILIVFLFLILVRYFMILIFYPFLKNSGSGCTWQEAIFIGWSGLRGAVSIALALSFYQSTLKGETTVSDKAAETLMFLAGGIAALTLLINATVSKLLLMKLGLLDDIDLHKDDDKAGDEGAANNKKPSTNENLLMFEYLKKRIRLKSYNVIESAQKKYLSDFLDVAFIFRHSTILKESEEANSFPHEHHEHHEFFGEYQLHRLNSDGELPAVPRNENSDLVASNLNQLEDVSGKKLPLPAPPVEIAPQPEPLALTINRNALKELIEEENDDIDASTKKFTSLTPRTKVPFNNTPRTRSRGKSFEKVDLILDEKDRKNSIDKAKADEREISDILHSYQQQSLPRKKSMSYEQFAQQRIRSFSTTRFPDMAELALESEDSAAIPSSPSASGLPPRKNSVSSDTISPPIKPNANNNVIELPLRARPPVYKSHSTGQFPAISREEIKNSLKAQSTSNDPLLPPLSVKEKHLDVIAEEEDGNENDDNHSIRTNASQNEADPTQTPRPREISEAVLTDKPLIKSELEEDQENNKIQITSRQSATAINHSFRMLNHIIYYELLGTMRRVFLDVLRVNYFKQINRGKLPGKSFAAILLLNSIDKSMNQLKSSSDRLNDFEILIESHYYLKEISQYKHQRKMTLGGLGKKSNNPKSNKKNTSHKEKGEEIDLDDPDNYNNRTQQHHHHDDHSENNTSNPDHNLEEIFYDYSVHLQTVVLMLISYIEGHEFAQQRLTFYLGETEGVDTPEEEIVINESKQNVELARELLIMIYRPIIKYVYSKRILSGILSYQQFLIFEFQVEGIINMKNAEILFHDIELDMKELDHLERKKIYSRYEKNSSVKSTSSATSASSVGVWGYLQHTLFSSFYWKYSLEYYFEEVINWYILTTANIQRRIKKLKYYFT